MRLKGILPNAVGEEYTERSQKKPFLMGFFCDGYIFHLVAPKVRQYTSRMEEEL